MADMLDEIIAKDAEIYRLSAELAEARRALLAGNDTALANKKLQEDNVAKDARIAELERHLEHAGVYGNAGRYWEGRWRDEHAGNARLRARIAHERVEGDKILTALEMANARIAQLEAALNRSPMD